MSIKCYAAQASKSKLEPFDYENKPLSSNQIEIKISHCGVCHSDLHLIDDDWGISKYPLVPGHEIIGEVTAVGSAVKDLTVGQRVGVGWQCDSCGECEHCQSGEENMCAAQKSTCVDGFGGYADKILVNSRFAVPIPKGLDSASAAPLLCGGVTVYSPLNAHVPEPGKRVGIVGIGGLGHLALQFAKAMGHEVTAFSHTAGKEEAAKAFGADHFVLTDASSMKAETAKYDFILSTVSAEIDIATFLDALRPNGKLCVVGVPPKPLSVDAVQLIYGRKSVCGSNIGSPNELKAMLKLAAEKGIKAQIEALPMPQVNEAIAKVRQNQARYRMVLVQE